MCVSCRTKWCCPPCNVRNEFKAKGEKKKSRLGDTKEKWGGGLATAGYSKVGILG